MVVGAKWTGMSISEPDDILGFSSHNHLLGSERERETIQQEVVLWVKMQEHVVWSCGWALITPPLLKHHSIHNEDHSDSSHPSTPQATQPTFISPSLLVIIIIIITCQWVLYTHIVPQLPDLNPIELLWHVVEQDSNFMDVQQTKQQKPCDHVSLNQKSEEYFQHESMS